MTGDVSGVHRFWHDVPGSVDSDERVPSTSDDTVSSTSDDTVSSTSDERVPSTSNDRVSSTSDDTISTTSNDSNSSAQATPATLARFAHPRTATPTTLAVLADPHLSTKKEGTWKVFHRTERRLRAAIADAGERDVDGAVFAGDLTEDGHSADFELVADILSDLAVPFIAVPGNHDVPKSFKDHETPPITEFESRFTPGELPFRAQLGGVDVLGLDSATAPDDSLSASHDGAISEDQLSWLESTLPETDAPVVVSHHNLPGLDSCVDEDGDSYAPHPPVGDAPQLADLLAGHDALHLSGHVHLPAVTQSGGATGAICPALSSFPQAYSLVEVGPEGTTIRLVPVADDEGVEEAYELARTHSERSEMVAEMVENQLTDLPLVDER